MSNFNLQFKRNYITAILIQKSQSTLKSFFAANKSQRSLNSPSTANKHNLKQKHIKSQVGVKCTRANLKKIKLFKGILNYKQQQKRTTSNVLTSALSFYDGKTMEVLE